MGSVLLAEDEGLERKVAIKIIGDIDDTIPDAALRFRKEAAALAKIRHCNVVQVYAAGSHEGKLFFAMEYVEGDDVERIVDRHRENGEHVPVLRALTILEEVAAAVEWLAAAPGLLLLALSGALWPALCGLSLYGIARGFFDANRMPIVRQLVDERYSATAYGFLNFIGCLTGGVMTYAGGGLRDAGLSLSIAFLICAAAIGLTSALCFTLRPRAA